MPHSVIIAACRSLVEASPSRNPRCRTSPCRQPLVGRCARRPERASLTQDAAAGTGAEVTKNAVLKSEAHKQKASLRSVRMLISAIGALLTRRCSQVYMYPSMAVVDPLLTINVPPAVTAATGLDAFTQVRDSRVQATVSCA
jgi:hypothetical protein